MVRFDLSPALVTCACERAAKRAAAMLIACDCAGHGPSAIVLAIDLLPVLADRDGFAVDPPPVIRPACPRRLLLDRATDRLALHGWPG